MSLALAIPLFAVGVALVLFSAERLVDGAVGTARALGVSAFVVSVVFIGFDPENLAVGAAGSYEGVAGIALGSILGAAMVAIALALGITALIAPLRFPQAPRKALALPMPAVVLFGALVLDGRLGRVDGGILVLAYAAAVVYVLRLDRAGADVRRGFEGDEAGAGSDGDGGRESIERSESNEGAAVATPAESARSDNRRWRAIGLLLLALTGIVIGSELIVFASEAILDVLGVSETAFGMTIVALAVSIEEVARELPAALRGHADISVGNVVGSTFAFFLLNAGIIALVAPVPVPDRVVSFHLPVAAVVVAYVSIKAMTGRIGRWTGALLVLAYAAFAVGSYAG